MKIWSLVLLCLAGSAFGRMKKVEANTVIGCSAAWTRDVAFIMNGAEMQFVGVAGEEGQVAQYTMLPADDSLSKGEGWMAGTAASPHWVIFDFGKPVRLDQIAIWNFNPSEAKYIGRSATSCSVYARNDDGFSNANNDKAVFDSTGWQALHTDPVDISQNPGGTTVTYPNVLFECAVRARYVAIDFNAAEYSSVGEVQFFGKILPKLYSLH